MPRISAIESQDPDWHRHNLNRFVAALKRDDLKWGQNYESFVRKLLNLFGNNPPTSWRFLITTYKYPAFRVVNKRSGRTTYFLRLPDDRIIIPHQFFQEEFRPLFPIDNGFYNTADEVLLDFSRFGEKSQGRYMNAITSMINQRELVSLNFQAH